MDQKWFISNIFRILYLISLGSLFYVDSYSLLNSDNASDVSDLNVWEGGLNAESADNSVRNYENPKEIPIEQPFSEECGGRAKQRNVLTFDKLYNLTKKDRNQNESKLVFINTEDHLRIYKNENEDDENEPESRLQEDEKKDVFQLLSPEGFLSRIISEDPYRLERSKRQAENGKRRCRCRKVRRRTMVRRRGRRRRRRNRVGQQTTVRRRRRRRGGRRNGRRGRRRCVCRKKGEGEEKSDGEAEGEDGGGEEEGTTEEGEESATEEAESEGEEEGEEGDEGDEGGDGEGEGEEGEGESEGEENDSEDSDGEEEEGSDEESDEEDDEEGDAGESPSPVPGKMPPVGGIPAYVIPYPNIMDSPIAMLPSVPIGSIPTGAIPTYKIPAPGALLSRKKISNTED